MAIQTGTNAKPRGSGTRAGKAAPAKTVRVDLEGRRYEIFVERGLIKDIAPRALKSLNLEDGGGRTAVVVMNPKIEHYYGRAVTDSLEGAGFKILPVILIAGETYKTLQTVRRVYKMLYEQNVDRRTVVFAVGGGVIGDVAGYVAATYQRGLDFVQVPTTLLAQVDSSVGGKVGVNFAEAKNLIGAFYQPRVVLIDPNTLESLPFRERRSGLAEIIKYGAIADAGFFANVAAEVTGLLRLSSPYLETAIAESCRIKARIVEQDERDMDIRAILNFGHTVGHAARRTDGLPCVPAWGSRGGRHGDGVPDRRGSGYYSSKRHSGRARCTGQRGISHSLG